MIREKKNETNQIVKSERHRNVGILGDNSGMCWGVLEILCGCSSGDIHLHSVDVCGVRRSNGRTEHLVDKTEKGERKMKKLLIVSTIIAIMCVCLVGCIDDNKPVEITATATTVQSIGEVKASDYNDGYHSNDYFIEVTTNADVGLLDGETFNFMLLMCKDGELLEVIRPIKELSQDKIVFHTNFALNEREFVLSIATGNGVYKVVKL